MPRCSVILVTYNSGAHIAACVRALSSQDCEIIVVDNASGDDTVAVVRSLEADVPLQLITISRNIGFAGGVNHGAKAASSDVLLILNPDAIAEHGAIDALLECFSRSQAAVIGGALLDADGRPAKGFAFRRLPTFASLLFEVLLINQAWHKNPVNRRFRCLEADYSKEQTVEQPAGACLAVTRTAWNAVEGMDEAFFPVWFEDVDFCFRLRRAGATIVYCPTARFRHSGAHSVGQLDFAQKQMFWYRNMVRYAAKHYSGASLVTLRLGIFVGMGLRALAALVGIKPPSTSAGDAVRSYAHVAKWAIGLGSESGNVRTP